MSINKKYYIGIDGGGTKTEGVIGNNYGEIIGHTLAESTNIQVKGLDTVKEILMNMISILRKQAKIDLNE
ncbi:BadF/BadG/BcrA/BcrD ATPase family protein, partial [Staphylococcus aureus]|nr:BadF/BadG/BcrA/BcrD ATPase family protein [Staphylococcus aureus]